MRAQAKSSTSTPRLYFIPEPVQCRNCGEGWARDPAITLACDRCGADAGTPCRRPRGGNEVVCYGRDQRAVEQGLLTRCAALTWDGRHRKPQRLACDPAFLPAVATVPAQGWLL